MNTSVVFIIAAAFLNAVLAQQTSGSQMPKYYIKVREEHINPPSIETSAEDDSTIIHHPKFQIKVGLEKSDVQPSPIKMELQNEPETTEGRFRRATCDLLSFDTKWGSLNHSACAAHCIAMRRGFRGGRCRDGVCHCRR